MGNEIVLNEQGGIISTANSIKNVAMQIKQIHQIFKKYMIKDVHYGIIPGTEKNTLYKAGAEILAFYFNMSAEYEKEKTDFPDGHREHELTCKLRDRRTGFFLGEGVGSCSTLEAKYRYRNESQKCPVCGLEKIIKGKKEYGGGWICFAKKGGCGAKFKDGDESIESQTVGKKEHEDPADYYNTVLKQGKKRAYVDGVITVTASSDLFEQKTDLPEYEDEKEAQQPQGNPYTDKEQFQNNNKNDGNKGDLFDDKKKDKNYNELIDQFLLGEFSTPEERSDFLEKISYYKNKDGKEFDGLRDPYQLSVGRAKTVWHKIQKEFGIE